MHINVVTVLVDPIQSQMTYTTLKALFKVLDGIMNDLKIVYISYIFSLLNAKYIQEDG